MSENQEPAFAPETLAEVEALLFATDTPLGADRIVALTAVKDRKQAKEAIAALRASGRRVMFVTNNSAATRREHEAALEDELAMQSGHAPHREKR